MRGAVVTPSSTPMAEPSPALETVQHASPSRQHSDLSRKIAATLVSNASAAAAAGPSSPLPEARSPVSPAELRKRSSLRAASVAAVEQARAEGEATGLARARAMAQEYTQTRRHDIAKAVKEAEDAIIEKHRRELKAALDAAKEVARVEQAAAVFVAVQAEADRQRAEAVARAARAEAERLAAEALRAERSSRGAGHSNAAFAEESVAVYLTMGWRRLSTRLSQSTSRRTVRKGSTAASGATHPVTV